MDSGCSTFDFETDQVALRENEDYRVVLSTLGRLESLRAKALADLDRLHDIKKAALENPVAFVQQLQMNPKALGIPGRPSIPEVPEIDWSKYACSALDITALSIPHTTRGKKVNLPPMLIKSTVKPEKAEVTAAHASNESESAPVLVRGRLKSESKPATYNQLWTSDEQRHLEQLLVEFPPERVEARRYRKIADRLGNKTVQQVASRIQKYFIRLAQAGLPVPGRVPNLSAYKRKSRRRNGKLKYTNLSSTMLQAYVPPVYMAEDNDGVAGGSDARSAADSADSDDSEMSEEDDLLESLPASLKDSQEYREILELRALRQAKCERPDADPTAEHDGYKCDGCGEDPIRGVRYTCAQCSTTANSIDFCQSCNGRSITLGDHTPEHKMVAVMQPVAMEWSAEEAARALEPRVTGKPGLSHLNDKDYLPNKFNIPGHYNYLDPNYMPADQHG